MQNTTNCSHCLHQGHQGALVSVERVHKTRGLGSYKVQLPFIWVSCYAVASAGVGIKNLDKPMVLNSMSAGTAEALPFTKRKGTR